MTGTSLCLIQFAKRPIAGFVKTRLIPDLGAEGALQVHNELLTLTLKVLNESALGEVQLWWDQGWQSDKLFAGVELMPGQFVQQGDDLGIRMHHAITAALAEYNKVLLVGSDCPVLSKSYLLKAAAVLEQNDIVLGPSNDGGYVLIGARKLSAGVLANIPWGTETVLTDTLARLEQHGLSVGQVSPLFDVDDICDYRYWQADFSLAGRDSSGCR